MAGSFLHWNAPAPLSISRIGSSPRSPQLINPRSRRRFRPSAQTPATSVLPPFFPPFLRLSFLECAESSLGLVAADPVIASRPASGHPVSALAGARLRRLKGQDPR